MLEFDTRPIVPPDPFAGTCSPASDRLDEPALEAIISAVDDRLETAAPDLIAVLRRGRAALELELARLLTR